MPLASATATSPQQQQQEQLGMNGWQSWLASPVTPTAQAPQSTAATLYPQSPQTASVATATGTNLTTTGANSTAATGMPDAIDPSVMAHLQTAYADFRPGETATPYWQDPATGLGYQARFGEPGYNGEGAQLTRAPITGYTVGNYDTRPAAPWACTTQPARTRGKPNSGRLTGPSGWTPQPWLRWRPSSAHSQLLPGLGREQPAAPLKEAGSLRRASATQARPAVSRVTRTQVAAQPPVPLAA
jgi:hypothetical protein